MKENMNLQEAKRNLSFFIILFLSTWCYNDVAKWLILTNDVEATRIAKKISLKELVKKYGDSNSEKVFFLDDYKMYLLNNELNNK